MTTQLINSASWKVWVSVIFWIMVVESKNVWTGGALGLVLTYLFCQQYAIPKQQRSRLICVDGNIGSGKSTLLEELKERYKGHKNVIFAPEPVSKWQKITNKEGTTIIELFYQNQSDYSFSFQMMAYISRLSILRNIVKESNEEPIVIISERSLLTDKYIFAKMLYDQGKIKEVDYQIYLKWFHEFSDDFPLDHCIYIETDPEICHKRIHQRARPGEEIIPLAYLQTCHKYHDEYVSTLPFLKLDGNKNIREHPEVLEEWIYQIDKLIY